MEKIFECGFIVIDIFRYTICSGIATVVVRCNSSVVVIIVLEVF